MVTNGMLYRNNFCFQGVYSTVTLSVLSSREVQVISWEVTCYEQVAKQYLQNKALFEAYICP